ncbi:MAG: hypothetical protein ABIH34_01295 [Nanoarchaeota archaeon]
MKQTTILGLCVAMILITACTITGQAKGGNPPQQAQCWDHLDNDGDGYCDFLSRKTTCDDGSTPGDPDCASKDDNKEATDCTPVAEYCDGFDNDCDDLVDEGLPIDCTTGTDCGNAGWTGNPYCGGDANVHKLWRSFSCNNPGTCTSTCHSSEEDRLFEWCTNGCINGACIPEGNQSNSS